MSKKKNQKNKIMTSNKTEMSVFDTLPNEIMLIILFYLSTQDLKVLDLVMKSCLSLKKNWFVLIKELLSPNYYCFRFINDINMTDSPSKLRFMIQLKDGRVLTTAGCTVMIWNILTGNCDFLYTFPEMINSFSPPVELEDHCIFISLEDGKCMILNLETKQTDYRMHCSHLNGIHLLEDNCGILIGKYGSSTIYDFSTGKTLSKLGIVFKLATFSKNLMLVIASNGIRTWQQTKDKHLRYIKSYHFLTSTNNLDTADSDEDESEEEIIRFASHFIELLDGRIVFTASTSSHNVTRILILNPIIAPIPSKQQDDNENEQPQVEGVDDNDYDEIGYSRHEIITIKDTYSILLELPVKHCQQLLELSVSLSPMVATTAVQSRRLLAIACNQCIYLYDFDQNQVIRVFQHGDGDGGGGYDTNQHEVKMVNLPHIQRLASYIPSPYLQSYSRIMIWNVIQGGCERILLHPGSSTIDILLVVKMPWNEDKDSKDGKKEGSEETDSYGLITSSFRNQMIFVWKPIKE